MANVNVTTDVFYDVMAHVADDTYTINSGSLTIRTDTRWHATMTTFDASNACVLGAGSGTVNAVNMTGGSFIVDARNTLWIAYTGGAGNVPALNSTITVSFYDSEYPSSSYTYTGYVLGVFATITSAPTAVGIAMPATGFLKIRGSNTTIPTYLVGTGYGVDMSPDYYKVVTGNIFTAITDVRRGWIEVVMCQLSGYAVITTKRQASIKTYGDWFYLDNTTGVRGQLLQVPTMGGGAGTLCPGVWVETAQNSNQYKYWPALQATTEQWHHSQISAPYNATDSRQSFVRSLAGGQMRFGALAADGDVLDRSGTSYAQAAALTSTTYSQAPAGTYVWAQGVLTISSGLTATGLAPGDQIAIRFTTGTGRPADATYTVFSINTAAIFTVLLAGEPLGGLTGSCYVGRALVTVTGHGMTVGEYVYFDTGTALGSAYQIVGNAATSTFNIATSTTTGTTNGAWRCKVVLTTTAAHSLQAGMEVYIQFTSGTLASPDKSGIYRLLVVATSTVTINIAVSSTGFTSGGFTIKTDMGHVPPANCRVRIPNIFLRQCATGTRTTNTAPVATAASLRPAITTLNSGDLDLQYLYGDWWHTYIQAYNVRLTACAIYDTLDVEEATGTVVLSDIGVSPLLSTTNLRPPLRLNLCPFGGTVTDFVGYTAGTPIASGYGANVSTCSGFTFTRLEVGAVSYARLCTAIINTNNSSFLTYTDCVSKNAGTNFAISTDITLNNLTHVDRLVCKTNAATGSYGLVVSQQSERITLNGFTCAVEQHPYSGVFLCSGRNNSLTLRNVGTLAAPLALGSQYGNFPYRAADVIVFSAGGLGTTNLRIQRVFVTGCRGATAAQQPDNAHVGLDYDTVNWGYVRPLLSAALPVGKNMVSKQERNRGCRMRYLAAVSPAALGTHFLDGFYTDTVGVLAHAYNETVPSTSTVVLESNIAAPGGFVGDGNLSLTTRGDYIITEMQGWTKGHTGFLPITPNVLATVGFINTVTGTPTYTNATDPFTGTYARTVVAINYEVDYFPEVPDVISLCGTIGTHGLSVDDHFYLTVSTGGVVAGEYVVRYVTNSTQFFATLASGSLNSYYLETGTGNRILFKISGLTSFPLKEGAKVWLDFTSGTGVDGNFVIYHPAPTNFVIVQNGAAISGNVSVHFRTRVTTSIAHGLSAGDCLYLAFTTGLGLTPYNCSGMFAVKTVPSATTFTVDGVPWSAASAGNVSVGFGVEYQIDTGSGYGSLGVTDLWTPMHVDNLIQETGISSSTGFKMKYRATCAVPSSKIYVSASSNLLLLNSFTLYTSTSLTDQAYATYPLDTTTFTVKGLAIGSDAIFYAAGTTTILSSSLNITGVEAYYTYEIPQNIDIGVFLNGKVPLYIRNYVLTSTAASLPVAQVADRNYSDPP